MIYQLIGKAVVKWAAFYFRARSRRLLVFALGFGVIAAIVGGYLASRDVPEG